MLARGSRVGTYEVIEPLGSGGMGEVFRAHDSRLGRDVALKVLSERFKLDPERRARFEREAHVLASLNHPNIATLHGIEEVEDSQALVLELVDGETLAQRLADGPIALADALEIARQIASALEAAHERGVIHRDLKPANVKIRVDGTVKLLDFGLAKAFASAAGADQKVATLTSIELGNAAIGTPAYMSPEQARGLDVDKRTDIWAFGCVLYEMLTGQRAFGGDHASDVLAKIIEREPDFSTLAKDTPAAIRRLLRRCLEKDPRRRLRDVGDARLELVDALGNGTSERAVGPGSTSIGLRSAARGIAAAAVISAIVAGAAVWLAVRPEPAQPAAVPRVARFSITEPNLTAAGLAISADGAQIAYITDRGLVVRPRDRLDGTLVAARAVVQGRPFFSPDGQWVGFTGWDALRMAPAAGGPIAVVADGHTAATGSWTGEDIVFGDTRGLFRVSADGGKVLPLLISEQIEQFVSPQMLPARQAVLFTVIPTRTQVLAPAASISAARIEALDLTTGMRRLVLHGAARPRYVPSGHLLYASGAKLYGIAFDLEHLEARGDAVPLVTADAILDFDVSNEGTLIYQTAGAAGLRELVWVDRRGSEESLGAPRKWYVYPRISPDGARVAIDVVDPEDRDVWVWDLRRSTLGRFTRDSAGNPLVAWSPDGGHLAFGSERSGVSNLFLQAADGSGAPERLLDSDTQQMPVSFAPDGRLLFSAGVAGQQRDIHLLSLDTRKAEPLIQSPANELWAEVSPDGRWVAYDSDESGQFEVYVRPFPDAYRGGRWQISSGGGRQPVWSRDGSELYYRDFGGAVMAASVTLDPTFAPARAVKLFDGSAYIGGGAQGGGRTYDVSPDGQRFLMIKAGSTDQAPQSLVVVLNWFEELKRLIPVP